MIDPDIRSDGPPPVTDRVVRQFAAIGGALLFAAAVRQWMLHGATPRVAVLAVLAVAIAAVGAVWPKIVRPVFVAATALTLPIHAVVSTVVLGIIYYGLFTPIAAVFRLAGRDALARRRPGGSTYWTAKKTPDDVRSYFRQA